MLIDKDNDNSSKNVLYQNLQNFEDKLKAC